MSGGVEAPLAAVESGVMSPAGEQAGVTPAGEQAGVTPAGEQAGVTPAGEQAGVTPAGEQAGANPAGEQAGANPAGEQAGANPAGEQAGEEVAGQEPGGVMSADMGAPDMETPSSQLRAPCTGSSECEPGLECLGWPTGSFCTVSCGYSPPASGVPSNPDCPAGFGLECHVSNFCVPARCTTECDSGYICDEGRCQPYD